MIADISRSHILSRQLHHLHRLTIRHTKRHWQQWREVEVMKWLGILQLDLWNCK